MSETIPENNLPLYLQQYRINIFNADIPEASIDTQEKKSKIIAGSVLYATVGIISSDSTKDPVWQLSLTGYLEPNVKKYHIVYDFSQVDYLQKEKIRFKNITGGVFTICGKVLNSSNIITNQVSELDSTLTIILDTSKWDFFLKKKSLFSYQLSIVQESDEPNTDILSLEINNIVQQLSFQNLILRIYSSELIYDKIVSPTMEFLYFDGTSEEFIDMAFIYEKGDSDNWITGQKDRGFDMYSVSLATPYNKVFDTLEKITVKNLANISYWSVNYQIGTEWYWINPLKLINEHFKAQYNVPDDPFVVGNKSTGCYVNIENNIKHRPAQNWNLKTSEKVAINQSDNIQLYRPDKSSSSTPGLVPDCHDKNTCLNTYLVGPVKSEKYPSFPDYEYGTIRIKVPKMYNGIQCSPTSSFDLLYFSLSTDFETDSVPENILPYWTVNAYQLEQIKNSDGFAYVFFANYESVYDYYSNNQKEGTTTPAIINRCGKSGFLLGNSKYLYLFRYRASNPNWEGSPDNAPCYETLSENQPVSTGELGQWCPIFAGENSNSFQDFLNTCPPI